MKKIALILLIVSVLLLTVAELLSPTVILYYAKQQITEMGVDEVEIELTSTRPHLLKALTNNLEGKGTIYDFNSVLNFERLDVRFSNMGLKGGDLDFTALISEAELSRYLKDQWDENIGVALTEGNVSISIPVNLIFVKIEATFNGKFQVETDNRISFVVENVNMNLPGFEQQATDFFLNNYKLDFSLGSIPYTEITDIQIKEGYLYLYGEIDM